MKKPILCLLLIFPLLQASFVFSQRTAANRYEAELLTNPNPGRKDTREVNAVIVFEKESVKIFSRRKNEVFKEFSYKNIRFAEHSFSKNLLFSPRANKLLLILFPTSLPLFYSGKEKHWLTIIGEDDFAVLKIESDNYRLIKNEFIIRNLDIYNINEDKQ
ncbi:MAG: hypothetical protein M3384_15145 [Acidobacteriota bacterium]|nr:hypothetical protein [Acidobacteriota bacterium]